MQSLVRWRRDQSVGAVGGHSRYKDDPIGLHHRDCSHISSVISVADMLPCVRKVSSTIPKVAMKVRRSDLIMASRRAKQIHPTLHGSRVLPYVPYLYSSEQPKNSDQGKHLLCLWVSAQGEINLPSTCSSDSLPLCAVGRWKWRVMVTRMCSA